MTQLALNEALTVIKKLDDFVSQVQGYDFGSMLLRGWLNELKTNVLQRSVNYAYAMDIDLIHYGFLDRETPSAVAIHELKFGKRPLENNKSKLQFEIATKLDIPFFFTQVIDPTSFIVSRVTEKGVCEGSKLDYDQWSSWQQSMSSNPSKEVVIPGEDSATNTSLNQLF